MSFFEHISGSDVSRRASDASKDDSDSDSSEAFEIEFEEVIYFIPVCVLLDYLRTILLFLESSKVIITFTNISRFDLYFLRNIAQDNSNLNCQYFSEDCKKICRKISRILESEREVYRLDCVFKIKYGNKK